jgi:hypothetical protein
MSCILTRCTYRKNLEMIQPSVQEKSHFMCFRFWPTGGQTKNQTGLKFGLWITLTKWYMYTQFQGNSLNGYKTCHCKHFVIFFELWPLWPWKVGQIQNPGNMWCSLTRNNSQNFLVNFATTVGSLNGKSLIFKMAAWRPQNRSNRENCPSWYPHTKFHWNSPGGYETCLANGRRRRRRTTDARSLP